MSDKELKFRASLCNLRGFFMKKLDDPENALTNFKGKVVKMGVENMALVLCSKCGTRHLPEDPCPEEGK